jgi:hypothetical protein
MEHESHYATVSEALEALRKQGFTIDFNLEENIGIFTGEHFVAEDFEIVDVYRYEGNTDPADEATVYAIASKSGLKGVLVAGFGMSSDHFSTSILKKLGHK